ncbi:hypothetical protein O2K51_01895 [Apibacter raozihei]|nr:hypothetical protein [Apibacter raozihei]
MQDLLKLELQVQVIKHGIILMVLKLEYIHTVINQQLIEVEI